MSEDGQVMQVSDETLKVAQAWMDEQWCRTRRVAAVLAGLASSLLIRLAWKRSRHR